MSPDPAVPPKSTKAPKPMPRDCLRAAFRLRHDRLRTEDAPCGWVVCFIRFHHLRHPPQRGATEINAFLMHLAVEGHVRAPTPNQDRSALLFLYQKVLEVDPGHLLPKRGYRDGMRSGATLPPRIARMENNLGSIAVSPPRTLCTRCFST
jgi:hypothetical protein